MTPLDHFEAVWARCDEMAALHAYLAANLVKALRPDELLRSEWVARVSALDLYVHELVAQRMAEIFAGTLLKPAGFANFLVTTETMDRIRNAATALDASAAFDLEVRRQLCMLTYQAPVKIADGIRLCSSVELWNEVALSFGATPLNKEATAKGIKIQLAAIVDRRNKIAHEGDLQPKAIPIEPWPISQADLGVVRAALERIVRAIDAVV